MELEVRLRALTAHDRDARCRQRYAVGPMARVGSSARAIRPSGPLRRTDMAPTVDLTGDAAPVPTSARSHLWRSPPPGVAVTLASWAGAAALAGSAAIHFHLWSTGYRHLHIIGPLFLLQAIGGVLLAVAVAALRQPVVAAAGALFAAGTVVGLIVSVEIGLFGFRDSYAAPYATLSLVAEGAAFVLLGAAAVLALRPSAPAGGPGAH